MLPVPIVVIDRSILFRQAVKAVLSASDFRVVGDWAGPREAAAEAGVDAAVSLVLCDLDVGADPDETVMGIRSTFPACRLVMLGDAMNAQAMVAALRAGVDGCLAKDISPEALVQSLLLVLTGERVFPAKLMASLVRSQPAGDTGTQAARMGLSRREAEILRLLMEGHSNKEIAQLLGITTATVKVHTKAVLRKIGVTNRTQAAIWALNNGMGE